MHPVRASPPPVKFSLTCWGNELSLLLSAQSSLSILKIAVNSKPTSDSERNDQPCGQDISRDVSYK